MLAVGGTVDKILTSGAGKSGSTVAVSVNIVCMNAQTGKSFMRCIDSMTIDYNLRKFNTLLIPVDTNVFV